MAQVNTVNEGLPAETPAGLVVAFANSIDRDEGTDDFASAAGLTSWLRAAGLLPRGHAGEEDLRLALRLRDGVRAAAEAHHDGADAAERLADVAAELPLWLGVENGRPALAPVDGGVRGALARILVAVAAADADDSWRRVKICAASDCAWAFVDTTKNRSRTWCEYGCGNKAKTRSYRARRRAEVVRSTVN